MIAELQMMKQPMNRSVRIKRLYSLGAYQNLEIHDEIYEIPEDKMLDEEIIQKLRYLMLIGCELDYQRYLKIMNDYRGITPEKAIELLSDLHTQLDAELREKLKGE